MVDKPRLLYRPKHGFFWRMDIAWSAGLLQRYIVGPYPTADAALKAAKYD